MKVQRESRGTAVLILDIGGGGWWTPCPSHCTPRKEPWYPVQLHQ